jgi:hypothetical protein
MTNAARQVVQAVYYEPFGRVRGVSTATGLVTSEPASYLNNRTFTGQYRETAAAMGSLMHPSVPQYGNANRADVIKRRAEEQDPWSRRYRSLCTSSIAAVLSMPWLRW